MQSTFAQIGLEGNSSCQLSTVCRDEIELHKLEHQSTCSIPLPLRTLPVLPGICIYTYWQNVSRHYQRQMVCNNGPLFAQADAP